MDIRSGYRVGQFPRIIPVTAKPSLSPSWVNLVNFKQETWRYYLLIRYNLYPCVLTKRLVLMRLHDVSILTAFSQRVRHEGVGFC